MARPVKLEDLSTSLNTILGLLVAVLVILTLSAVFRFIFFCFCRKGNAIPPTVKCDFKEHLEKLQEVEANALANISKKLSKSSRSQSKRSKQSKKDSLLKSQTLFVDLESGGNGVYEPQLAEVKMLLEELVAADSIKERPNPVVVSSQLPVLPMTPPPTMVVLPPQPIAASQQPTIPPMDPVQKPPPVLYPAQEMKTLVVTAKKATSPHVTTAKEETPASVALGPTAATPSIILATTQQGVKRETAV